MRRDRRVGSEPSGSYGSRGPGDRRHDDFVHSETAGTGRGRQLEGSGELDRVSECAYGGMANVLMRISDVLQAPKATQHLTLIGGGADAAFGPQREGVLHLEEMIMSELNQQFVGDIGRKGTIKLSRRVFKKVRLFCVRARATHAHLTG